MRPVALSLNISLVVMPVGCMDTTVEEIGTFKHDGQVYVIQSTTPGDTSEANARDLAIYSVKVEGEKVICNGTTSDCRAVTEKRLRELESGSGTAV